MYSYQFKNTNEVHEGMTGDFLEVVCQIALYMGTDLTGDWLTALLTDQTAQLDFLRMVDWKFDWYPHGNDDNDSWFIKIQKHGY